MRKFILAAVVALSALSVTAPAAASSRIVVGFGYGNGYQAYGHQGYRHYDHFNQRDGYYDRNFDRQRYRGYRAYDRYRDYDRYRRSRNHDFRHRRHDDGYRNYGDHYRGDGCHGDDHGGRFDDHDRY